jgi:CheY-like chemotaxis protein
VKIYSEVGHGTTIRLYLPRFVAQEGTVPAPQPKLEDAMAQIASAFDATPATTEPVQHVAAPAPEPATPARKTVVLVVEDNPSVRDVAAAMIEDMGFEAIVASNGHEGLHHIASRSDIDLVLSDVIMAGGMNGPEMAQKALEVRPELKVLFMSGYAPGSLRQMQQDLPNAVDLVNKPFTRGDLTEKVKKALAA